MQIIIHRGTHQIGGCATEIRTGNTRILIDFGAELPDAEGNVSLDTLKINGLNCGKSDFDGVFFTHYDKLRDKLPLPFDDLSRPAFDRSGRRRPYIPALM